MSLFTKELHLATFDDITEFCDQKLPENVRLDYKRQLSSTDPATQVVKLISSFSNTLGGLTVYGVSTDSANKPTLPIGGMPADRDWARKVQRWCLEHIYPPLEPQVQYIPHPSDASLAFGLVRVEPSWLTPHTIEGDTGIYVRRADNSDPVSATLTEIDLLRNRRARAVDIDIAHGADLRARLVGGLPPFARGFYLQVVPRFSREDAVSLEKLNTIAAQLCGTWTGAAFAEMRTYSHGIMNPEVRKGWRAALTTRGAGAVGERFGQVEVEFSTLLQWSALATDLTRRLAYAASHHGDFLVHLEAPGFEGAQVVDSVKSGPFASPDPFPSPCIDNNVTVNEVFSADEVKNRATEPAGRLFIRLLNAFGQGHRLWTPERIAAALKLK